jgi:hypothetical protein
MKKKLSWLLVPQLSVLCWWQRPLAHPLLLAPLAVQTEMPRLGAFRLFVLFVRLRV